MIRSVTLALVVATVSTAAAQDVGERADALFKKGKELIAAKHYREACVAFDRSYEIENAITTLLNRADCREKNGQLATAHKLFQDAQVRTHDAADDAGKAMHTTATNRILKLAPRLSKLAIRLPPERPQDFKLTVDGADASEWGTRSVDGGAYTVEARATGYVSWSRTVVVENEGDSQAVDVPQLEAGTGERREVPEPRRERPTVVVPSYGRSWTVPATFGIASLTLGAVAFGLWRSGDSLYNKAELEPDDAEQARLWDSANKRRYAAEAFGIGALACVGVAVVFIARHDREPTKLTMQPVVSPSTIGLTFTRGW